jgi:outer membrane scaffolding protein for murein synthesis (MipA/OmpV family)
MDWANRRAFVAAMIGCALAVPAAAETGEIAGEAAEFELAPGAEPQPALIALAAQSQAGPPADAPAPRPFAMAKPVFDETWASVGLGLGFVPSYSGSDDYQAFPLPLIAGRVGGVGISPNGPGFVLDLFSPAPTFGPRKTTFSAGPAFRVRADRVQQIGDDVVDRLQDLNLAFELGGNVGVSFPGVFNPRDSLSVGTQVRWDVAGAHEGMVIEPQIGYRRAFGTGIAFQAQVGVQFVDDRFADYYFSVSPEQSALSGLPQFQADGGLNSLGGVSILSFDLDGNLLNGGLSIYTVLGYSRLVGDASETPFTDLRGDPNQFLGGVGVGYTF